MTDTDLFVETKENIAYLRCTFQTKDANVIT